ncbi:hypothetical protein AB0C74_39555 [Spirillospora sp. NPDC048832]
MHAATDRLAHLLQGVENIRRLAERADPEVIESLLAQPAAGHLDDHTLDFLRRARDLLFITTQTLSMMLRTADPFTTRGCRAEETSTTDSRFTSPSASQPSSPLDAAEAWRRAHLHFARHHEDSILVHIEEFEEGYRAMPIVASVPEPPSVPTIETPTTLVIDKATGAATLWPLLRLEVLTRHYRSYKRQAPISFDSHSR